MQLRSLLQGMVAYGVVNILQRSINVLLVPLYLNALPQAYYGAMDMINAIGGFVVLMFMWQMESGLSRYYYEAVREGLEREYLSSHIIFIAVSTGCGALLMVLLAPLLQRHYFMEVPDTGLALGLMAATVTPRAIGAMLLLVCRLKGWKLKFGIGGILDTLLTASSIFYMVVVAKMGIVGIFLGQLAGALVSGTYLLYALRAELTSQFSWRHLRRGFVYSVFILPGIFFGWMQEYLNRFIMKSSGLPLTDIALYAAAAKFTLFIAMVAQALNMIWQPEAIKAIGSDQGRRFYARVYHAYVPGMLLFTALLVVLAKPIVTHLAPPAYMACLAFIPFMLTAAIISNANAFLGFGIVVSQKSIWNSMALLAGTVMNVSCQMLLIHAWGIYAVVAGYLAGIITGVAISAFAARKLYPIPFQKRTSAAFIAGSVLICLHPFLFPDAGIWKESLFMGTMLVLSLMAMDAQDRARGEMLFRRLGAFMSKS